MDIGNVTSTYKDIYKRADESAVKLKDKLGTDYSDATDEELMDVCKQFESYFLEQVMKEMIKTIPTQESSSASMDTMTSYYKDEMVRQVASEATEQSSLGLAKTLYDQMRRNYGLDPNSVTAGELAAKRVAEQIGKAQEA